MQTHSVNSLAEEFEVDRGTLVKALRNIPPDAEKTKGRPTWKTSTAMRALEAHRRRVGRVDSPRTGRATTGNRDDNWHDPLLMRLFSEWAVAETAMRKLKTLAERRKAAIALGPKLAHMDAMSRKRGVENGNDEELTQLRCDQLYRVYLRGFEECCAWTTTEVWQNLEK